MQSLLFAIVCLIFCLFPSFATAKQTLNMAVLGNSVSQGTDSIGWGVYPEYNWASGTKIRSHLVKLEEQRDVKVIAKNVSIVGAHSNLLGFELERLGKDFIPDYATIEIGANDVCMAIGDVKNNFLHNVKSAIEKLIDMNPNVEIIVTPIARLSSMTKVRNSMGCKVVWDIACPSILGSLLTEEQRQHRQAMIDDINVSTKALVSTYPQVHFNITLGTLDIPDDYISTVDCFHPSVIGQQAFSDLTFDE